MIPLEQRRPVMPRKAKNVLCLLATGGGRMSAEEIMQLTGWSQSTAERQLYSLSGQLRGRLKVERRDSGYSLRVT